MRRRGFSKNYLRDRSYENIRNEKVPGADSCVNEFFKHGGSEVKDKLLKIMNVIFRKGEVPSDFSQTLIKPLYKEGNKSEGDNCRGTIIE